MSFTGPGCAHCNYTGRVMFGSDHLSSKPCDRCGGVSLLREPPPSDMTPPANCTGCGGAHVPGRACTPLAKRRVLQVLARYWNAHPQQRLGQALVNVTGNDDHCLFGIEDADLVRMMRDARRGRG